MVNDRTNSSYRKNDEVGKGKKECLGKRQIPISKRNGSVFTPFRYLEMLKLKYYSTMFCSHVHSSALSSFSQHLDFHTCMLRCPASSKFHELAQQACLNVSCCTHLRQADIRSRKKE